MNFDGISDTNLLDLFESFVRIPGEHKKLEQVRQEVLHRMNPDLKLSSEEEKPHKQTDPRYKPVVDKIFQAYQCSNKINPPWGIIEGKQLKQFLKDHSDWDQETIFNCIRNRWRSGENLAQEPRRWIPRLGDFASGPLNEFGKPKATLSHQRPQGSNPSGTNGALNHIPDSSEMQRRKAENEERCRQRRQEMNV